MKVPTSDIIVGSRIRRNIDDGIDDMVESYRRVGQLQPIVVDGDFKLVAGARRLRACELLGIEVDIVMVTRFSDAVDLLLAERDENTCRKDFTPSEAVEIGKRIEALEAPKAAERKAATQAKPGNDGKNPAGSGSGNLPEPENKGETRDKVAAAVGMSPRTYDKAKAVVENGTPELVAAMDAGDISVNAASKAVKLPKDKQEQVVEASKESKASATKVVNGRIIDDPMDSPRLQELKRAWIKAAAKDRKAFLIWARNDDPKRFPKVDYYAASASVKRLLEDLERVAADDTVDINQLRAVTGLLRAFIGWRPAK